MVGGELSNIQNSRALVDQAIKKAPYMQKQNEDQQKLRDEAGEQMALLESVDAMGLRCKA